MCRQNTSLFDLKSIPSDHHDSNTSSSSSSFVHEKNSDILSWPIAGLEFKQKASNWSSGDANDSLGYFVELKEAIEGYGVTFRFHDDVPEIEFEMPLTVGKIDEWDTMRQCKHFTNQILLQKAKFDSWFYFDRTASFHGKISFEIPVSKRNNPKYFYDELSVVLQFSQNKRFVRNGYFNWKLAAPQTCPLDGTWEVKWQNGNSMKIKVQDHFFLFLGQQYDIEIDDNNRPWFSWGIGARSARRIPKQISNMQILPGSIGPEVGEVLEWTVDVHVAGHDMTTWKRLTTPDNLGYKFSSLKPTAFAAYHVMNNQLNNDTRSVIPTYHGNTIWGNVFCQAFCVGLASYHFETDEDGNHEAYISYENPRTSEWPNLDNGMSIPSRVPFRNIQWNPERRVFKGDICWLEDQGTTWNGESKWSYEMQFNRTFLFIVSGTCSLSDRDDHQFGRDLVYVNAALEQAFLEFLCDCDVDQFLIESATQHASTRTLQMIRAVALSVESNSSESIFDFNL